MKLLRKNKIGNLMTVMASLFFILGATCLLAQTTWSRVYNFNNPFSSEDDAIFVQRINDGGFIVLGASSNLEAPHFQSLLLKLDSTGIIEWQKAYGSETGAIISIQQTSDGGYIAAGGIHQDIWVLKLNSTGAIVWQKTYGGPNQDEAHSIQQTSDGGYVMAGFIDHPGAGCKLGVQKLDASGNIIWQKKYGGTGYNGEYAHSIRQTSDGGYIVAGMTDSFGAGNYDYWVLKLDSSGAIEWQKAYGGPGTDEAHSIQQTSDGGYIFAGDSDSYGAGYSDIWVLKLNASGNIDWQKTYGGTREDHARSIMQTSDGGYILAGASIQDSSNYKALVFKLDADGNILWQKLYGGTSGDVARFAQQTPDGGYIVAGKTYSFDTTESDIWILKLDSSGTMDPACNFISDSNMLMGITNTTVTTSTAVPIDSTAATTITSFSVTDTNGSGTSICDSNPTPHLLSHKPVIDDSTSSTPNGIIEEDEPVDLIGKLENVGSFMATSVAGVLTSLDPITINDPNVTYPDIAVGAAQNSINNYNITAPAANRPSTHWDFTVTESPSCVGCPTVSYNFLYHVGNSFLDVPVSNMFYSYIETIFHFGVTDGCDPTHYCPWNNEFRRQVAKFICVSMENVAAGSCNPASCTGIFGDVSSNDIFCAYIEALYQAGITSGCQNNPLLYCPESNVQRQALAKSICLGMNSAIPGSCILSSCVGTFSDVPASNPFCAYIEGIYNAGVISGCQTTPLLYCPSIPVTRAQMAKLLVNAFGFSL